MSMAFLGHDRLFCVGADRDVAGGRERDLYRNDEVKQSEGRREEGEDEED